MGIVRLLCGGGAKLAEGRVSGRLGFGKGFLGTVLGGLRRYSFVVGERVFNGDSAVMCELISFCALFCLGFVSNGRGLSRG